MNRLCEIYIRRAKLIGIFYSAVPVIAWFVGMMCLVPFRGVYLLRLALSLAVGGYIAARLNDYGVRLWLLKHRSQEGPATVMDGFLMGAGIGVGINFIPPLTSIIGTNHPEEAKLLILLSWLAGIVVGGLIGATLASVGRTYVARESPVEGESRP